MSVDTEHSLSPRMSFFSFLPSNSDIPLKVFETFSHTPLYIMLLHLHAVNDFYYVFRFAFWSLSGPRFR
jgi:hypothetical protein